MGLLLLKVNQGLKTLEGFFESGEVIAVIDKSYSLTETPEAFRRLLSERAKGKLVVSLDDSSGISLSSSKQLANIGE